MPISVVVQAMHEAKQEAKGAVRRQRAAATLYHTSPAVRDIERAECFIRALGRAGYVVHEHHDD